MGGDDIEFLPLVAIDDKMEGDEIENFPSSIPVLPLRNTVLFPSVVIPITVGREKSIKAVQFANKKAKFIIVVAQKNSDVSEPESDDLCKVGTLARIIKILKMPDGNNTVIIQGKERCKISKIEKEEPFFTAKYKLLKDKNTKDTPELKALASSLKEIATQIIEDSPGLPAEAGIVLKNIENPIYLIHFISSNLNIAVEKKQRLLEIDDIVLKAEKALKYLHTEFQLIELKNKIQSRVRIDIEKQQRDYFLHQQLKTIQDELGSNPQSQELAELKEKAEKSNLPIKVKERFAKEVNRLDRMNPAVAEYSILLNYLQLVLELPWNEHSTDNFDLVKSREILDRDHFGLDKIKDRIIEHLAVLKLKGDMKSPILCFVGPPGVGKTSLGKSIAEALDRKYVRISLGGLHDEAEIRGHRKTYIGALPGRIIQSIKKAGTSNPVFVLDEIDKIGNDFRGDPSSALLEVLDPEQNNAFYDNFLELEFDLSKVLFIATANEFDIQPALLDRMEVIELSGYSQEEKTAIAIKHLIPKQIENHGLKKTQVKFNAKGLAYIIKNYTRESGVREMDRKIASIMRNVAKSVVVGEKYQKTINPEAVEKILGKPIFNPEFYIKKNPPGVAIGLAWTSVGGEILFIETSLYKGGDNLVLTGNLGDVMKESAATALTYLKTRADEYGLKPKTFDKTNIHIHIPEGAIPKDGPSAGITMLTALASAFTDKIVKPYLAMSGEITLRGTVLPVGGIKEKILAAKRAGMKEIILCKMNEKDVGEIKKEYIKNLKFIYVENVSEVLDYALV